MAKRKVKRKAPKRKRKVVKRKRKAPKRRRKRKFGMLAKIKEKAAAAAKAVGDIGGKAKTMFIDLGGKQILPLLVPLVDFENVKKKLKNDSQKTIANDIEEKIKADLGAGDLDLKGTIVYFKETTKTKGEELKETFYTMIQEKQIYTKLEDKVNKAFEKIPNKTIIEAGLKQLNLGVELNYTGFLSILKKVYTDSKDVSKKLSFNILGSLLSKNPTESDYKKNLITDITAAGTAAITTDPKTTDPKTQAPKEEPKKEESKKEEPKKEGDKPQTGFGKRKKGPSASLKKLCKKHGVRLTVKRKGKRVYKSVKVLKGQCKRKTSKKKKVKRRRRRRKFGAALVSYSSGDEEYDYSDDEEMDQIFNQVNAALTLQALQRGRQARKKFKEKREKYRKMSPIQQIGYHRNEKRRASQEQEQEKKQEAVLKKVMEQEVARREAARREAEKKEKLKNKLENDLRNLSVNNGIVDNGKIIRPLWSLYGQVKDLTENLSMTETTIEHFVNNIVQRKTEEGAKELVKRITEDVNKWKRGDIPISDLNLGAYNFGRRKRKKKKRKVKRKRKKKRKRRK